MAHNLRHRVPVFFEIRWFLDKVLSAKLERAAPVLRTGGGTEHNERYGGLAALQHREAGDFWNVQIEDHEVWMEMALRQYLHRLFAVHCDVEIDRKLLIS